MIVKRGNKYYVKSEDGKKNLGKKEGYDTKEAAVQRLKQIEYYKNH